MNLKQLLFLKGADGGREISFTYTLGAYIERFGSDPYVRTACSPYTGSNPNKYAAGYAINQEYYTIQNKLRDEVDKYPIRFGDANKIIFDVPDNIRATVFFVTSVEKTGGYAKFIDGDLNPYDSNVPLGKREIIIPEGADSFGFSLYCPDGLITDDIMKSIKVKAIKADWIERLITGNPVLFMPNAERDLLKFDVPLSCSQSGSGDPSPSNVRPITGISSFTIWHTGKNMLQNKTNVRGATSIYIGQDTANVYPIRLIGNTVYSLSYDCDGTRTPQIYIQASGESAVNVGDGKNFTFTPDKTSDYRMYVYVQGGVTEVTNFQLEVGSAATEHEAHEGTTYQIAFPTLGKNLFNKSTGIELTANHIRVARNYNRGIPFHMKAGITYCISTNSTTNPNEITLIVPYTSTAINTLYTTSTGRNVFTPEEDINVGIYAYWTSGRPEDATDLQVEVLDNFFDASSIVRRDGYYVDVNGNEQTTNETGYTLSKTPVKQNEKYLISNGTGNKSVLFYYYSNDTFISRSDQITINASPYTITTPSGCNGISIQYPLDSPDLSSVRITEFGPSAYEPYTNTAYGGTLDVTTGVLTLTHAYRKYVGASSEQWYDNSNNPGCFVTQWTEVKNKGVTMCNMSPANNNSGDFPAYGYVYNQNSSYNVRTHIVDEALTISQFKSWLAEHPLELVCPLINSVTVQLDPVTIQTLIGTNTIWTNTNGSNTIKYLKKEG